MPHKQSLDHLSMEELRGKMRAVEERMKKINLIAAKLPSDLSGCVCFFISLGLCVSL